MSHDLNASLLSVKGIGEKTFSLLEKISLITIRDLLEYYPRTYRKFEEPISELDADAGKYIGAKEIALYGTVSSAVQVKRTKRFDITTTNIRVGELTIGAVWFRMPYIRGQLNVGEHYVFYGKLGRDKAGHLQIEQAKFYTKDEYFGLGKRLHPVYNLTKGLKNSVLEKSVDTILKDDKIDEHLPDDIIKKRGLISYDAAIRGIHFPKDDEDLKASAKRLSYDEFFMFLLMAGLEHDNSEAVPNPYIFDRSDEYEKALGSLPYELTDGQKEALSAMKADMESDVIQQRLIQGDVGSGKTIISFLIMLLAVENSYQAAIMAPTEVLAKQHYLTFKENLESFGLDHPVYLLTGSMKAKEKREVYAHISSDEPCFIIGTHALIQEKVEYHKLAIVVTDEQHRFGVKQRKIFSQKGSDPYTVVMSATPIPRTLAMILYQDMQISAIRDVPARRLPIKNAIMYPNERQKAYQFIGKQIQEGHQAYIICPLVDSSEKTEAENVTEYSRDLQEYMGSQYRIGMLHGKMKPEEKNSIMEDFHDKKLDILVSTTVVEVGVNVPNATVMMIENADRFGLAQLHQLRGRVGRGDAQSYCIFMDCAGDEHSKRLEILKNSNDGFEIASEDLKLRGPGDFYGVRQSGDMSFKIADLYRDADILSIAKEDVNDILKKDPTLSGLDHTALRSRIRSDRDRIYENL